MSFKLKASVAALAAIGFGTGIGSAVAAPVIGAGASAVRNTAEGVVAAYCVDAAHLTKYAGGGGQVTRLICTSTQAITGLGNNFDFTYDSNGGSWRGFTATNTTLDPEAVIQTATTTGCTATATATIGTVAGVTVLSGCPVLLAPTATAIGFTDVESALFFVSGANQPTGPNAGGTAVAFPTSLGANSFNGQVLGVVFGVAASKTLYTLMQSDQMGGAVPSTCVVGASLADAACAPSITRQQYRSIIQNASSAGGGALQFGSGYLFTSAANVTSQASVPVNLARRDPGSGTQAGSNATFLGIGCAGARALPDLTSAPTATGANETVTINASTGGVTTQLGGAGNIIGIVSAENAPTATWGFLKLDGVYPSSANAVTGKYDYFTEETLYCKSGASSEEATLCRDIQTSAAAFANTAGAFSLTALFSGYPAAPASGTYYRTLGNTCGKSFAQ
jgi:hypothetical protein